MSYPSLRPYQPTPRQIPLRREREESLQRQICNYLRKNHPDLIFRSDYASGLYLTMHQAVIHKSLQSGRSFPDLFIYKPSRDYAGLALELKKEGTTIDVTRGPHIGELTADPHIQEQALMLQSLNKLGYFARFGVGYEQSVRIIEWYLNPHYTETENGELF